MAGTQPNAKRRRPMVTLTMAPAYLAKLDQLAAAYGYSRSFMVEWLVDRAQPPSQEAARRARER